MASRDAAPLLGGIEAGGTKFVLAVGPSPREIVSRTVIPTTTPDRTLAEVTHWFAEHGPVVALGIASFGPVELDRASPNWGYITDTPKPGWAQTDIAGPLAKALACPVGFDTDVNGAALAEATYGAGGTSLAYITVGTGIGVGLVTGGRTVHGAGHPEMGHIFPRRDHEDFDFPGHCPFHGDCMEGLASGPAIMARWGATLSDLPPGHPAHTYVAGYLAQLCHTAFATVAVETIVLGGGVMQTPGLLDAVRERTFALGAEYLPGRSRQQIVAPKLGQDSGISGALQLAARAFEGAND
ncbi:MAG: fructokinase [Citromicrobium sp.]|nr:fructokinase [Citromicrobium sp.]MBD75386.1 fructokinase [Citromicrobium sp.]MBT47651.1 fructokinase [Citromicrobium sp.]|tara:strand:+ start:2533 stop:3423 length:891 start_codon:yes stop_codon:yes gene_type:complete